MVSTKDGVKRGKFSTKRQTLRSMKKKEKKHEVFLEQKARRAKKEERRLLQKERNFLRREERRALKRLQIEGKQPDDDGGLRHSLHTFGSLEVTMEGGYVPLGDQRVSNPRSGMVGDTAKTSAVHGAQSFNRKDSKSEFNNGNVAINSSHPSKAKAVESSDDEDSEEERKRMATLMSVAVDSSTIMQTAAAAASEAGGKRKARRGFKSTLASKERAKREKRGVEGDEEDERGPNDPELKHYQIRTQAMLHDHLDKVIGQAFYAPDEEPSTTGSRKNENDVEPEVPAIQLFSMKRKPSALPKLAVIEDRDPHVRGGSEGSKLANGENRRAMDTSSSQSKRVDEEMKGKKKKLKAKKTSRVS